MPSKAADTFSFQRFTIDQAGAAHRVGEDSILFGGWVDLTGARIVLDVGTGTGILSLIAAQRSLAHITALEIQPDQVALARRNVTSSPFAERVVVVESDFSAFDACKADHILSNPPYFLTGPQASGVRGAARHLQSEWQVWMKRFRGNSVPGGLLSLVLPLERRAEVMAQALEHGWFRQRECHVRAHNAIAAHLMLVTFGPQPVSGLEVEHVCVRDKEGRYHPSFQQYTSDLYL
ncbi:MAG: tRNA1(Val) (adenine(37)-N6)-methyltransferase [Flavobacteriales bacterium]